MFTQYIVLFLYFAILFGIGIWARGSINNLEDYYVGGKRLGYWVVAFSARATGESAWLLLGLTGLGAMVGVSALWIVVGEVIGVALSWMFMARPFKEATDRYGSITVPDYLVSRFSDGTEAAEKATRLIRIVAAGALAIFVTIYVSAQIDATGKAFEQFLGWNYYTGLLAGFAIVVLYTLAGGFVAVAWSDLFQGAIMLLGLVLVPVFAFMTIPSGSNVLAELGAIDPGLTNIWGKGGLTLENGFLLVSYAAIGLGFLGSPQVFVRFMSIKSTEDIKRGTRVAILYTIITDTGAVLTGILGRYLLVDSGQDVEAVLGGAAEGVLPLIVEHLFPTIVVGIFIAAVLSAIMSTIDSLLVLASSAVVRDYYQQIRKPHLLGEDLTGMSRAATLAMALGSLAIALVVSVLSPDRTVFWFAIFGWSGIAATFCPVIILTLFWRGYNVYGVLTSMVVGFLSIPFFKFAVPAMGETGRLFALMGEMAPSFAAAMIAGYIVSRLKSLPSASVASLVLLTLGLPAIASAQSADDPDPQRFAEAIAVFSMSDRQTSTPDGAVLFVGSSSIRMWQSAEAFPSLPVINRGFGGSEISDVLYYFDRIVEPYDLSAIVFYCGDNDIAAGKSAETVESDFREFMDRVTQAHGEIPVIWVPIKPSTARWSMWPEMEEANARVAALAEESSRLWVADVVPPLLGSDGAPDPGLLREDGLHLTDGGYDVWNQVLQPVLTEALKPSYVAGGSGTRQFEFASGAVFKVLLEKANLGGDELEIVEHSFAPGSVGGGHLHTATEVFYVLSGELDHVVNGVPHALSAGMIGVVRPGDTVVHRVWSTTEPARVLIIWTPGGEIERLFGQAPSTPID